MKHLLIALIALASAACSQTTTTHGQVILQSRLEQVQQGVSTKGDVERLLGSPSTKGTLSDDRWVYISSVMTDKPLNPDILNKRQIIVIDFDPSGTVASITGKSEADAKELEPAKKTTTTHGQSLGILEGMMQNLGNFGGN